MTNDTPKTIRLNDYRAPAFLIENVALEFDLHPDRTQALARMALRRNPVHGDGRAPLSLLGENLELISLALDGRALGPGDYTADAGGISLAGAPDACELEVITRIAPAANTKLEGLYQSSGIFCTQCEAEGFRKITYYPDRPDVMAVFTVTINGSHPVLLSNGNPTSVESNQAIWHDPWPKPSYLFALVAGDLVAHSDSFTTMSGRKVALNLYVRPGDEGKCAFGMEALKRSMKWDEDEYGREYDLDLFNIVAVDDFNMGAMENKGLNIFNSSAVLASPETSTDMNFERIEAIIAHEYFHNWTGNRITCRDWFQLCLKEGLTVFRDSQFTSDMRSAPVKRISDVIDLRARQFAEDQGPLAHPVRPESFQEINNFYTATVYEKGAEVIGMLKLLVGDKAYSDALDLYFDRHDGQACTIEDWLRVFEDTTGRDLTQFKRWYSQAGTPHLSVTEDWQHGTLTLKFRQHTPASAATPAPQPQVLPIAVGLIGQDGDEVEETRILEMTEAEQSFVFDDLGTRPIASVLRGFSAPVVLKQQLSDADRAHLLAYDTDPFNRWEQGRMLAFGSLLAMIREGTSPNPDWLAGVRSVISDESLDPAFRALVLGLPSQSDLARELADAGDTPDPDIIYAAVEATRSAMAKSYEDLVPTLYRRHTVNAGYEPDAEQSGKRSLANAALSLLTRNDDAKAAQKQYDNADNMTQQLSALANLIRAGRGSKAVQGFENQWKNDRLVMDKWFGLQVMEADPEDAHEVVQTLTKHPDFNWKNPNRFRAVFGSFAAHHAGFHHASGVGYQLLADWLIKLDPLNPQTTARMCAAFQTWRRYDADRQALMKAEIDRILAQPDLSRDTTEMLTRIQRA